jgi:hypothetical protein
MQRFDAMDGTWRGQAKTTTPSGDVYQLVQTERVGPFLDGSIKIVEGRGYEDNGEVGFNALGVISYDPGSEEYNMRTYAQGQAGDFQIWPTDNGFHWEIPAGRWVIRYTAVITDSTWSEVGERFSPEGENVRFFEMNLRRVGDTNWPGEGAVEP